ncbi:MAG: mitochondrial fission ELM1 family protein [Pseudomonadota bacterium]
MTVRVAWALSDGRRGVENQALGLAEAIAQLTPLKVMRQHLTLPSPWRFAPTALAPSGAARAALERLMVDGPPPDIIIGCGRQAALATIEARRLNPAPFRVQIQRPRAPLRLFDLVIPPAHDLLAGDNVVEIIGAPGRLTKAGVADAAASLDPAYLAAPRPRVAALIGGPGKAHAFSVADQTAIRAALNVLAETGWTLFVTTSRRTPAAFGEELARAFGDPPHRVHVAMNGRAANPYPGVLGLVDAAFVTADSVNMASEAATVGLPVSVMPVSRKPFASRKLDRFHTALIERGAAKWFDGDLTARSAPPPFDETARAAEVVLARWRAHDSWKRT